MIAFTASAKAEESQLMNQVYFKGGLGYLTKSRGNEVFTDTLNTAGTNNGKAGYSVGTGIDLAMTPANALFGNFTLVGQMDMQYSRFSKKAVRQATSALLGGSATSKIDVGLLHVSMNPKLRVDSLGRWHPYIQPVGLAFLVNSPASNDTTYLDLGLNFGAGVDVAIIDRISLGVDVRYTHAFNLSQTENSNLSAGAHVGINF